MVQGPGQGDAHPHPHPHGPHEHTHEHTHEHGAAPEHDHHGFAQAAAAIGHHDRRRRWERLLLGLVFGMALATLGAELWLRQTDPRSLAHEGTLSFELRRRNELSRRGLFRALADPVRRFGLEPRAETRIDDRHFRISAQGTRGPDVPSPKPAGEKRLLVLGGAFAFGLSCDEQETLASRLVARANAREEELESGVSWRALELGVPGYHVGQSRRALEQDGLALEPDLVVLCARADELEQTGCFYDEASGVLQRDYLPLPSRLRQHLWSWSRLYGWIASAYAREVEDVADPRLDPRVPSAPTRADNQAYTRAELAHLAELCRAHQLPLFVIDVPRVRLVDEPTTDLDDRLRTTLAELALPVLHAGVESGAVALSPQDAWRGPDDTLSAATTATIADLAHARLRAEGLLP